MMYAKNLVKSIATNTRINLTNKTKFDMENIGLYNAEGKALSMADVMAMLPTGMINRVEVIDEKGRSYVNWKPTNRTELQVQDNGRTLKVFVSQSN